MAAQSYRNSANKTLHQYSKHKSSSIILVQKNVLHCIINEMTTQKKEKVNVPNYSSSNNEQENFNDPLALRSNQFP